ncbi:aldose 1-epimerase family protein [Nonomuraea sp. NPDC050328]|uniref:aldose 1-epimerase family protein n=1 Tax=Nonomuraea sp. NPDC050328 TaxID=3364361 RepID=UPI0037946321
MQGSPLIAAGYTAEWSVRGAAVRALRHGDRDLITSWPAEGPVPFYAGTILAPWPNRVGQASYRFGGREHHLEVTEPDRGHALHGLVATADWRPVEQVAVEEEQAWVRLAHAVTPVAGYPFTLDLEVTHRLDAGGLTTTLTAANRGADPAPYGCGPHPWLVGEELELPAGRVLLTDAALLPAELAEVAATPYDFGQARTTAGVDVDHAFTGLAEGRARVGGVLMEWDPAVLPWVQVCTGAQLGYRGVAVEPMTCPPDAFNSGDDLITLAPGQSHSASWTIRSARPE